LKNKIRIKTPKIKMIKNARKTRKRRRNTGEIMMLIPIVLKDDLEANTVE